MYRAVMEQLTHDLIVRVERAAPGRPLRATTAR
jgi:hypothetical protein